MPDRPIVTLNAMQMHERRKSISEAFHTLNQPLTSLHCGIELALAKPCTAKEYQKRLQDALVNAGAVLELNRAIRELVDAVDPGERLGSIALASLLAQVVEEVSIVTEASGVTLEAGRIDALTVAADPMKLLRAISVLLADEAAQFERGTKFRVSASIADCRVQMCIVPTGTLKTPVKEEVIPAKAQAIRREAALWYIATLGGGTIFETDRMIITLPLMG